MKERTTLNIFKPALIFLYLVGYFPYKLNFINPYFLQYSKLINYFNIVRFVVQQMIAFFIILNNLQEVKLTFPLFVHGLYIVACVVATWLIFLFNETKVQKLKYILCEFYEIDNTLKKMKIFVSYDKLSVLLSVGMYFELTVTTVFSGIFVNLFLKDASTSGTIEHVIIYAFFFTLCLNHISVSFIFVGGFLTIKSYYSHLNQHFQNNLSKLTERDAKDLIIETKILHQRISEFARLYNSIQMNNILVIFGLHFVLFTSNTLYVCMQIVHGSIMSYTAIIAVWILFCGTKTYVWVWLSSACMSEVRN